MNPKIIGGVQLGCGVLAILLGFLDMTFFAILLLGVALLVTGIDKFAAPGGAAATPAYQAPRAGAPPAY
ncbi:hypothetical protein KY338_05955 [Candidatus Woesearchaeota archaeon]|nr:hypothetical protein [Candidatus Woesearchaeota archaeon]MBW3006299.1 hypothetical protein [Candidatus Woesearchaeota archaeon]